MPLREKMNGRDQNLKFSLFQLTLLTKATEVPEGEDWVLEELAHLIRHRLELRYEGEGEEEKEEEDKGLLELEETIDSLCCS